MACAGLRFRHVGAFAAASIDAGIIRGWVQMNIQQIVYFLVLSEELHFTRAAKRCGIAQPSLTNSILALEAEFGAPLFHRRPKPRLSQLGQAVKPDLQRALVLIDRALTRA